MTDASSVPVHGFESQIDARAAAPTPDAAPNEPWGVKMTLAEVLAAIGGLPGEEDVPFRDFMDYEDLETFAVWHLDQLRAVRDAALAECLNIALNFNRSDTINAIRRLQEGTPNE